MLDAEARLHAERGTLFNGEGLLVEAVEGARAREVDDDVRSPLDF